MLWRFATLSQDDTNSESAVKEILTFRLLRGQFDPVLLDLAVERALADPQQFGGANVQAQILQEFPFYEPYTNVTSGGFSTMGWIWVLVMAVLLVVGEIIESFLGVVYVAHKGATKWGVLGAFLGGIAGAIAGGFVIPFVGSIIFGLIGAFVFAVLFEYIYYRRLDRALQTGFFAFVGKLSAMFVKLMLSLFNLGFFIYLSWA